MTAYVSALDLFSIGIGPSSSHTVGPMRAARTFADHLLDSGTLPLVTRISCALFGSLGSTGLGHGTPDAVLAGLAGLRPETCDPAAVRTAWSGLPADAILVLHGHEIPVARDDITFEPRTRLPGHPNALTLTAWGMDARPLFEETWYSIGGGFIRRDGDTAGPRTTRTQPLQFSSSAELLALCDEHGFGICDVARANEESIHGADGLEAGLDAIWDAMHVCVEAGLVATGTLPGGLKVKRRAAAVRMQLEEYDRLPKRERDTSTEWLHAFALAVNEENASGGRVVTAPTNGAAGIIPAVGHYYLRFVPGADAAGIRRYLLTAVAIGSLVKANASISGAEGGCQAEVGSACAMASAALCAVLGGTPRQVENAAEIAMEHHLGLTCDPVGGLVQVPCIERNAIAASTAVSAARLALHGDGTHLVSLDTVIETMRQTGLDMMTKYKETSEGGLAVNVIEC
ncbi:L-serine ammonia-lyase [Cryobacterium sp. TMT1-21]|uniref:L-serine dehydratase n=1 Tax=Cryobacterium shii TaxID=1259235 RepID=A0AAQ2C4I4_9MICO|nr:MULTISPECIES: L-serine ammonia-lyase [Cryobacterium]TFC42561.1 L-serine ammonia-lyase [Cryobacterium shii]TFC80893.1 L-serine ammonia-lyase [Cryobacterium sp. TmT2-59]TFD13180.1 L-serine ammonia-lyase [Cryobacterium sp. TMT1-21]TFD18601.1 L-serine ammonia-lyase [Cryobacterium sp. TMT4-10]TFD28402.1 L-serine ammonia-lyase [Cryobacterium sp. TMT2-23]